jgi:hypothetical protein
MSELSKVALQVDSNASFPNNNNGYITPAILRSYNTNVIDSTVNQIQYTADSGSWNSKIGILNAQTGSYITTGSNTYIGNQIITGSITATVSVTTAYFYGDGSNITNVNQSPILSLNAYTASQDTKNATLATYTGSNDTKFSTLSSTTASFSSSIGQLNSFTSSQATKNTTLGFSTSSLNAYSASNDTKWSTLSPVTASFSSSLGHLNQFTYSQYIRDYNLGVWTGSQDTKNVTLATYTGSNDTKWTTLAIYTASFSASDADFNAYTASQNTKNATLGTYTGSIDTKFSTLGTYTQSVDTKFTTLSFSTSSLNAYTASLITAFTASGTSITVNGTTTLKSNLYVTGGVYQNVVSQSIVSSTASLDLSQGTYFNLTLADNTTTHIRPTNLAAGVSATLVITTGTNSTASLAPILLQPLGNAYNATSGSGKIDVLSLTSTNTSNMFVVSAKNMI